VEAASNEDPALFVYAVNDQLDPLVALIGSADSSVDLEKLRRILMELVSNAVNARLGNRLMKLTGFTRERLLGVFGVNILYPDDTVGRMDYSNPDARALETALGMTIPLFVRLTLKEKFTALGVDPEDNWVYLDVLCEDSGSFWVLVGSSDQVCEGDLREILRRFERLETTKSEIRAERAAYEDERGIFRMPSFTGGGGFGLIWCIEVARNEGLNLACLSEHGTDRKPVFSVSNLPPGADR
jgi:hypothetical protein